MTLLRLRMIEDMKLAGLAPGTQANYLAAVRHLAAHYRRSPDQLSEDEVHADLLALRDRGVALGTFKTNYGGIQFPYRRTLELRVAVVLEKRFVRPSNDARPTSCRTPRSDHFLAA